MSLDNFYDVKPTKAVEQTVEMLAIWDPLILIQSQCND